MEYTTLKEYTYELNMKESIDVVAVFITVLTFFRELQKKYLKVLHLVYL